MAGLSVERSRVSAPLESADDGVASLVLGHAWRPLRIPGVLCGDALAFDYWTLRS
jgi:hypothetical protein